MQCFTADNGARGRASPAIVRVGLPLLAALACSSRWPDNSDDVPPPSPFLQAQSAEAAAESAKREIITSIENDRGMPARLLEQSEFEALMVYYCGECHGTYDPYGHNFDGTNLDEMVEDGKIIPGDAAASRLVMRMQEGSMPPTTSGLQMVPDATLALIVDYIDALPVTLPEQSEE